MNHSYFEKPQNTEEKSIEKNAGIVVFIIEGVTYAEVSYQFFQKETSTTKQNSIVIFSRNAAFVISFQLFSLG